MRFFDTNFLFNNFGGSVDASSNTAVANLSFDEDKRFSWSSNGENTDGNAVYLERVLAVSSAMDRIFVKNTNISNLTIQVDIGAGYVTLATATSFTLVKSDAGDNYYYTLDNSINVSKIKFEGSNTIITNEEKTIQQCLGFTELGTIENNDDIQPKRDRLQAIAKLNSGRFDIINKGRQMSFKLKFKAHYKSEDNAIIKTSIK